MKHQEQAQKLFVQDHYRCSQAVLGAFAEELGLSEDQGLKIAGCFGSGMCMGDTCGCVTGGLMALGLRYGHSQPEDEVLREREQEVARTFTRRFREVHGSTDCRTLLGRDVTDPEELARIKEEGLFYSRCPQFVDTAVQLVEELLGEE